jgi:hypothetical protein
MRVKNGIGIVFGVTVFCCASIAAQWPRHQESGVPRDAQGNVLMDAPAPRSADGKPDFSGLWMRANSAQPGGRGERGGRGEQAQSGNTNAPFTGGRGGVVVELPTAPFPVDPNGPPIATFFEAGGNIPGGLPYTPWAADLRKRRMDLNAKDNPDANCLPMGFLQFHQQPQPRKIIQTPKLILIEYEANYGIRHIYMDGRPLPPQGEPQPWWYGYSVGRWEGDTLVVETNNLRGAEDSAYDGWLDVNGSPYSQQARFIERFRRPTFGHLQIDITVEDPKAYTKPFTVRVDQRILPDQELIEFVCNENNQFRSRVKID